MLGAGLEPVPNIVEEYLKSSSGREFRNKRLL